MDGGTGSGSPAGRAVDDAVQRPDRQLCACVQPRPQLFPAPLVHPDLTPTAAFAAANENRSAGARRGRARRAQAPPGREAWRATTPRSAPVAETRGGRSRRGALPPRSHRALADRPGSGFLCCVVGGQRGSRAASRASGAARRVEHGLHGHGDLLRSESRYGRCPTRPTAAALPLASHSQASARIQRRGPTRPVLVQSGDAADREVASQRCCKWPRRRQGDGVGSLKS